MFKRALLSLVILCAAIPAFAQELTVSVGEPSGATVPVTVANSYDFAVTVVNVRLTLKDNLDQDVHYFSTGTLQQPLEPGGEWTGPLTFALPDGSAAPEDASFNNYDRASVAAAVDIEEFAPQVQAALDGGDYEAMVAALQLVRLRTPPISRSARFHESQVAASGMPVERYFNLPRVDAMQESLNEALCEWGSNEVINLRGNQEAKQARYNELANLMRDAGLHINCINSEARLSAARMLLAGSRGQDALLFKEVDEEGNLLPEWVPIYTEANLALVRTAVELGVTRFDSIRPALEALNNVHDLAPENAEMLRLAAQLVPNAASWVVTASGPLENDLDSAQSALEMIRPRWSQFEQVEAAAATFAEGLITAGIGYCERREFVNARNRFVRGERILEGIPAWEARADEINHCRALGALEEGREIARHPVDNDAPARGYEKLEEAQQRFELTEAEVNAFRTDIASAWVGVATRQLEVESGQPEFPGAMHALGEATEVSPTGITDAIKNTYILFAEKMYAWYGLGMSGAQVEEARAALVLADGVDPERISAVEGQLSMAYYGYRVGIPAIAAFFAMIAGLVVVSNKRKAKRFADMDVSEI